MTERKPVSAAEKSGPSDSSIPELAQGAKPNEIVVHQNPRTGKEQTIVRINALGGGIYIPGYGFVL